MMAIVGVGILWSAITAFLIMAPLPTGDPLADANTLQQLVLLLHNPGMIISVVSRTLISFAPSFCLQFIGVGLWVLPLSYYSVIWCILASSAAISMFAPRPIAWWPQALVILGISISASILTFAACYLGFTRPAAPEIVGLQARYFIPLALLLPGMLPSLQINNNLVPALTLVAVAMFPAISITVQRRMTPDQPLRWYHRMPNNLSDYLATPKRIR